MIGQAHFPQYRPRRLRRSSRLRRLVQETALGLEKLVAPLFIKVVSSRREPIPSMPGVFRLNIAEAAKEAEALSKLGVGAVLLFGIPAKKDLEGSAAYAADGVIPQAVKAIKRSAPGIAVITDVCLCEYTSQGHCGILKGKEVDNDATISLLSEIAISYAKAGADLVAPSAMMDGQVGGIRKALDREGLTDLPIMSYSAKYASALYGPFREAAESMPRFGDRSAYQMDPANVEEALREVAIDIEEGADIVMVKPASLYLDVLRQIKETFHWPTACYQVSGEYSLIKAAALRGWVDERRLVMESHTAMIRSGADLIITYYAKEIARWLKERRSRIR